MLFSNVFTPKPTLSDRDVASGLRWMTYEGIASMGFSSVAGGAILAAFALILGATNSQIGILAAIPPLAQPIQIPAILLIEKLKRRKLVAVLTWLPAQLIWIPIALIPMFMHVPSATAVSVLLGLMGVRSVLAAFTSCSWNGWVKDLVPQDTLAGFFARRQQLANITGMVFGLGAAFFADYWLKNASPGDEPLGYSFAILAGAVLLGLSSPVFMSLMPEPLMQAPPGPKASLLSAIIAPLKDRNYRNLLRFLMLWWFAVSLSTPFFAVYMLNRLELSISTVMILSMVGMLANIMFLRLWGKLADRLSSKAVLSACASLYLLVILGWVFTTMPERYWLSIPLLVILQIMAGIAGAGVGLTIGTISMKLAPSGQATTYLATAGLASSIGAATGPILGGIFAQFFATRELSLNILWIDSGKVSDLSAISLTGFDFLFGISFLIGLITLIFLTKVEEEGEVEKEVILDILNTPMRELSRPISTLPGVGIIGQFPFGYLKRVPVPGLDVAIGVTAHQLAETSRLATVAALQGRKVKAKLSKTFEKRLRELAVTTRGAIPQQQYEFARHVVRGGIHSIKDIPEDIVDVSHQAVLGIVKSLISDKIDPVDALQGVGYGAVQGAMETGEDPVLAAIEAIKVAGENAREMGLTEAEAVHLTVTGIRNAVALLSIEDQERVIGALSNIS